MAVEPTIYALSSGAGKAGVAVIRISGPLAGDVLDGLSRRSRPKPRVGTLRTLVDPASGYSLDRALTLWFPSPGSFTGEDCVELHVHGGRAVINVVLCALAAFEGLRLAEPGEFARRAFFNGKLDLTQAEALADLIDADSEAQRRQALAQLAAGGIGGRASAWRDAIIRAQALCEAAIDFSDEGDVALDAIAQAEAVVQALMHDLESVLAEGRRGEIVREGFRVAIVGPPNVGKSSLLNAISRREVAIVSDEPGTTRDVIEVSLDLAGLVVVVADTAGLREAAGRVEQEGIRRAIQVAERADLILEMSATDVERGEFPPELHRNLEAARVPVVRIKNKIDLAPAETFSGCIGISTRTGEGIGAVLREVEDRARRAAGGEAALVTRVRHRILVDRARGALASFLQPEGDLELRAEDLRAASYALGRLTGRVDVEDVLGEIFGRFCIGK